jgi:ABC-2 type transport system ATP-binding protein
VLAVDRLSFTVEAGEVVGFLGPNGAGKTTTLRMLLGLVRPDEGTATINGSAYADLAEPLHQVGAVLEASSFHPGRTARNHLRVQALAGRADPSRVDDVLELTGLKDAADRRIGGFSLGMRQRLGLATALLPDPELLILGERPGPRGRPVAAGLASRHGRRGRHRARVQSHPGRGRAHR